MRRLLPLLCLLASVRCATIVNGRFQEIPVTSDPPGAAVSVACDLQPPLESGVTPVSVVIRRGARECVVTVAHATFGRRDVRLERTHSRAVYGNAVPGVVVTFAGMVTALLRALEGTGEDRSPLIVLGAAAIGFGVPLLIDWTSGAMYKHEPERIDVELERPP